MGMMRNTGFSKVAAKNPGFSFSVWDGDFGQKKKKKKTSSVEVFCTVSSAKYYLKYVALGCALHCFEFERKKAHVLKS